MIPVAMPGIAAVAIIAFLMGWAQFLFPLILTTDLSTQPVTVIVAALDQQRVVPFTLLMACGAIAAAIPGVLALVLNRYIIQGVTAGSIK
jgi:multiple sugar transport system permease protein